jgi:AraC-like DNA-binding protein
MTLDDDDIMDGFPIPVAHGTRSFHPGWLTDIARLGKGGNNRDFYGIRMMMAPNQHGVTPVQVAAELGFTDQSHPTRRFKAAFGVTPSQYAATTIDHVWPRARAARRSGRHPGDTHAQSAL